MDRGNNVRRKKGNGIMELEAPPQAYSFVAWSLVFRGGYVS